MNSSQAPKRRRLFLDLAATIVLCALAGGAWACTATVNSSHAPHFQQDVGFPGTALLSAVGPEFKFTGCNTSDLHELTIRLEGQSLTPVSTVVYDGTTYVTYQTSDTSPLFFFHVRSPNSGGFQFALKNGEPQALPIKTTNGGQLFANPYIGVVGRVGMSDIPSTPLGKFVLEHPLLGRRAESALSASVTMRVESCALNDAPVSLPDVEAADLAAADSHAHETGFNVRMTCSSAGIPLSFTLTDANQSSNTGTRLVPIAGSTAKGVSIELLRGGTPVELRKTWSHGTSSAGAQDVPLQARYARSSGALQPGSISGQAILTLDYR
ncbi:TPA: hypothetical protein UMY79_003699 [Stenotrophomonas maltophilia]|nr:hypothetical protein [Stenotrophomonas maltophilia]